MEWNASIVGVTPCVFTLTIRQYPLDVALMVSKSICFIAYCQDDVRNVLFCNLLAS